MKRSYVKHGLRKHPLYNIWIMMKKRCYNKNDKDYSGYGGRGITVTRIWIEDFKSFYNWAMSNGWERGLQIDRRDNDGHYSPSNCRITTGAVNCQNRRNNKLNWDLVKGIRLCGIAGFTHRAIGKFYNITHRTVGCVLRNEIWRI